ncbi:MAG: hypothetical protein HZB29_08520 [Nitrospinae bacterium]|nr:hypothetical protein [Nitrospinota bacterium]
MNMRARAVMLAVSGALCLALFTAVFQMYNHSIYYPDQNARGDFWRGISEYAADPSTGKIPFQIPGPQDQWAGPGAKKIALPVHSLAGAELVIKLADTHPSQPPELMVEADGRVLRMFQTPAGSGQSEGKWLEAGGKSAFTVHVPANLLRPNTIVHLSSAKGSWAAIESIEISPDVPLWSVIGSLTLLLALLYSLRSYPPRIRGFIVSVDWAIPGRIFFAGVIALTVLSFEAPDWDKVSLQPDSSGYMPPADSYRTYGYPLFIKLVAGDNLREDLHDFNAKRGRFVAVARAQKIVLFFSLLALFFSLSAVVTTFPAFVFCYWFYLSGFLVNPYSGGSALLAETLTQSFVLLAVSSLLLSLRWPGLILSTSCALFSGLAMTARPDSAYTVLFLGAVAVILYSRKRGRWLAYSLIPALLFGGIYVSMSGSVSSMQSQTQMRVALQFVTEEDIANLPDEEAKAFIRKCLEFKKESDLKILRGRDRREVPDFEFYDPNFFDVAGKAFAQTPGKDPEALMKKTAPLILAAHRMEWLRVTYEGFYYGARLMTRFGSEALGLSLVNYIPYILLTLAALALLEAEIGAVCLALFLGHLLHSFICSVYLHPQERYIFASEWLVVLAAYLAVFAFYDIGIRRARSGAAR